MLAAAGLSLASCGGKGDSKTAQAAAMNAPIPVTLQEVTMSPASYYDEYPGTATALSQVELRAEVSGYITGIYFKEGDVVHKGQVLYEIDKSKYLAALNQAQANMQVAQANQAKAQKDADRYTYLAKQDAVAKQIVDHALTDLENAKSGVASANANVVSARTDLNFAVIKAPFDGTIGLSQVKLGTLVTASQTLLNTISTDNPVAVDFVINENEVPRFQRLQASGANTGTDSLFTILLPDKSMYGYEGKISVIDRAVNPQTGTLTVRLEFPNPQKSLKAGMSTTVRVHNTGGAEQILIPSKATVEQMAEYFVFLATDTTITPMKDGKSDKDAKAHPGTVVHQVKVQLGQTIGANVIVKSGLQPGQKIVTEGLQKLHDNAEITTATPAAQGAQGGKSGGAQSNAQGSGNH